MINPAETIAPQTQPASVINTAETVLPGNMFSAASKINAAETVPPGNVSLSGQSAVLLAGESVSDSYVIHSLMNNQGKQSNVYLARKDGKSYVVKIYHNGWHPSAQMQAFLTSVRHPNIANVVECGTRDGNYYEIYEYYSEGKRSSVIQYSSFSVHLSSECERHEAVAPQGRISPVWVTGSPISSAVIVPPNFGLRMAPLR